MQENIDYFNYIDKIKEDSLHAKLLTLGASLTGVNYPNLWPGLNHFGIKQIIHKYMNDVLEFTNNDEYEIWDINYSLNPNKSDEVRDFVIEKIDEGYPVLVWVGSENESENGSGEGGSHWVVAYDYDETTDKIYCNFGWGRNSTHATPENYVEELNKDPETNKNYYIYKSALAINIKLPHRCSDNYGVITTDDMGNEVITYYCYCDEEIELYTNTPTFVKDNLYQHQLLLSCGCDTFQPHVWNKTYDENGHSYICKFCNEYILITHTFTHISIDNLHHLSTCTYDACGMEFTYNHNWTFVSVDGTTHTATCRDCGYTETKSHNLEYSNITSTSHTYGCTDCGYSVTSEHDMSITKIPLSSTEHGCKCIDCNYVDESTVEPHSFNSWVSVNTTTHQSECDGCNARGTTTAPHAFVPANGSLLNVVCVDCGYTKRKDSDFGNVILSITKVSANGSYILPDGTIMLVDEDIEAYLNGTLVFYDKDNVPQVQ